ETMRLYPPAPIIGRKNKESIQIGTHVIPPKSHIAILIYMLHKTPDVFPNPEKFDPDRFSAENMATRDTYSFIPFSLGPRICIGHLNAMMQMKIVLCHIIRNFKVVSLDPLDKMNVMMTATLRCVNPIRLKITIRE
ncbi:cytochrome P450 4g1-like, partial [Stegodyphus dumicola]|uniref:cytochrome P450 4g1-like n=1 Tax=Stegodyphus dumicola TaxID=202533 RepID=UPI0015A77F3C